VLCGRFYAGIDCNKLSFMGAYLHFKRRIFLDKPFRTFDEQVEILEKRMHIDSDTKYCLMRYNYYSIINFYKEPFLIDRQKETYITGTHFNEIKSLFLFDRKLRILFFNSLTKLELSLKTLIAYHFSEEYKTEKEPYLNPKNYFLGIGNTKIHSVSYIIKKFKKLRNSGEKDTIKHYLIKDNIPFWIIIHFLSYGDFSIMFSILNRKVQNSIVKSSNDLYKIEYNQVCFLNERFIETFLKVSTNFRNAAGHNEKFYSFTAKDSIVNLLNDGTNRQKLYSIYGGLKIFLPKKDYDLLTEEIKEVISDLENQLKVIDINIILKSMDFPKNWHKKERLQDSNEEISEYNKI
jgi:abortive infection bacteriophage resistance protein